MKVMAFTTKRSPYGVQHDICAKQRTKNKMMYNKKRYQPNNTMILDRDIHNVVGLNYLEGANHPLTLDNGITVQHQNKR